MKKITFIILIVLPPFLFSCTEKQSILATEAEVNQIVHQKLGLENAFVAPEDKNKDEFGCVVRNDEKPQTKCIESTGSTCSKLHGCESVAKMRGSGLYTEKELRQSEEIANMFKEIYNGQR